MSDTDKSSVQDEQKPEKKTAVQAEPSDKDAGTLQQETAEQSDGKTVLIVEDEKPLSHALEMKLKNEGFNVESVANGEDALIALGKKQYSMVLLDLIMPKMDGFAVLQEINNRKIGVPVVVLSNLGQEEDRAKAKEMGAIGYFVKSNTPISAIVTSVKKTIT